MRDDLGDRMKEYEGREANRKVIPRLPVCARIDGKCFSKFTRGLERPYDIRLSRLMIETTRRLMEESAALAGYTQSDEISLLFYSEDAKSQMFFDGRIQKMTSILASMTTALFNSKITEYVPEKKDELAMFDCRVWELPDKSEATNTFLWRELDASRNSVSMAARTFYSHEELQNRTWDEMQELLFQKGINWNEYPVFFKRGTFLLRKSVESRFSPGDLSSLPLLHDAHTNPDLVIRRSVILEMELPAFSKISNRVETLFEGAEPVMCV